MEHKEITPELKATAKEWKDLSTKTFRQVNKKLWTNGRLGLGFGIVLIATLWTVVATMDERNDRDFDRNYGNMMQGRECMMWKSQRGDEQLSQRWCGKNQDMQWAQGCSQKAILEIDPETPIAISTGTTNNQ